MADRVTVSSHHSYGSRVGNSLKAILGGIILVGISIWLLAWNESRYAKTKAGLEEGNKDVQETVSTQINPDLEGKEVHLYGESASNDETLRDDVFGIVTNDLKLRRTVEMYQWYEESDTECHDNYGGSEDCDTTYTYDTKWSDDAIDSNDFYSRDGHENPSSWEYESYERVKEPITLGVYTLTPVFVSKLTNYKTINLSEQSINTPEKYKLTEEQTTQTEISETATTETATTETATIEDNNNSYLYGDNENTNEENTTIENINTTVTSDGRFHIDGNQIYIGADPTKPAVGDLRITFSSVRPGTVSVVGKQVGNELTTHTTSNGTTIALLEQGNVTADDMFLHEQQANKNMTWILRLFGLFLMYCGFSMMFKFIETLAKVLPFLASIIGVGTGIVALGLTLVVGFLTIGIAWLAVRPVIGICCLVVSVGGIFLLIKSKKTGKDEKSEVIENKD